MNRLFCLAAALCLIGQSLVAELHAADRGQTNLIVEVLIFSGRPNPTWRLQDTNRLHLLKAKLKDLPAAFETEPADWSRLGFAGFRVHGGEALGLPAEIRIYRGVIKTGHGKAAKYVKDSEGLENLLISEAKEQSLESAVRDAVTDYENARKAGH